MATEKMTRRRKGRVKWFNPNKGYGFIVLSPEDNEEEIAELFAHQTAIKMDGFRTLEEGQLVSFNVEKGAKGWQATEIQVEA